MAPRLFLRLILLGLACVLGAACSKQPTGEPARTVGVVLLVHGGFEEFSEGALWDSTLQIFSYDPNSFVYQKIIWSPDAWPMILRAGNAPKELGKYSFELERIGGFDPAMAHTRKQLADLTAELDKVATDLNVRFVTDYMNWIGDIPHMAHPRALYEPGVSNGAPVTYCGEQADGKGGWAGCDPQRYNVAGTIDRMLAADVDEIVVIDLTTSGVRFFKSNDVVRQSRQVVADHNTANGTNISLHWLNDPADLMRDSYPDKPAGWTSSLGAPTHDPAVPLVGRPNPVSADPGFAALHATGIEQRMNPAVATDKTGIVLVNHATRRYNQLFDPKIDDTLELNANIRDALLARNPGMQRANIVGAWMGIKEEDPAIKPRPPTFSQLERTRTMRGENLGHAYLYETDDNMPTGEWGYLYWDALEHLKSEGVEHIVVAFPQITVDSVLNLVELPNQIAKEIGYRNWLFIDEPDFETYPDVGHPFADYWGIWVTRECPVPYQSDRVVPCCFDMGGCADGRPYPPLRLAPTDKARNDLDPSLAYDVSEYGHLGYDPAAGAPDEREPVQGQYTGTWASWTPPNADPAVGKLLAGHIIEHVRAAN
jgi:hypothetical protein